MKPQSVLSLLDIMKKAFAEESRGQLLAKDKAKNPVMLDWEMICQRSRLAEKINSLKEMIVQSFVDVETEFARQYPQEIQTDYFLKPLAPLLADGSEKADWKLIEKEGRNLLEKLITGDDYSKFFKEDDIHLIVTIKDKESRTSTSPIGLIHFLISANTDSEAKVCNYAVAVDARNRGLGKLLISSIFKLFPVTKKITLMTRITNQRAQNAYYAFGFTKSTNTSPNWINLEYNAHQTQILQKATQGIEI